MKKRKGFTLVEIISVIVIVGVLLAIIIPSVTGYINNSRKSSYVATSKSYIKAVKNKLSGFKYRFDDENSIYYVPVECIDMEKAGKSPYGDWKEAYVVVTYNNGNYTYYWTSADKGDFGIKLTKEEDLSTKSVEKGIDAVDKTEILDGKSKVVNMDEVTCDKKPDLDTVPVGYQVYPDKEASTISGITLSEDTYTTTNNDPYIELTGLDEYKKVTGVVVYFKEGLNSQINTKVFYKSGGNYENSVGKLGVKDSNKIIFPLEEGTYSEIKVKLGDKSGISYKIEKIELVTEEKEGLYTNKDIRLYVGGLEVEDLYKYSFDDGQTWTDETTKIYDKNQIVTVKIKDRIGSISERKVIDIDNIDKINPICELSATGTKGENDWYTSDVDIAFGRTVDNGNATNAASGVRKYGLESFEGNKEDKLTTDISTKTYVAYILDKAGNSSECSITVKRDTEAPTCTFTSNDVSNWQDTKTLTVTGNDATSGIWKINDGTGLVVANSPKTRGVNKTEDITATVMDGAGHTATCGTIKVTQRIEYRSRTCNSCSRCSAAGCSSYATCENSACGERSCATSACGVASYNTCETAACGSKTCAAAACGCDTCSRCSAASCATYDTCTNSDCCGSTCTKWTYNCYDPASGHTSSTCAASGTPGLSCGKGSCCSSKANTCTKSCCGCKTRSRDCAKCGCDTYKSCADPSCGYYSCPNSACGVAAYNTCPNSACGYYSCSTPGCGCSVHNSNCSSCGCANWGAWTEWTTVDQGPSSATPTTAYGTESKTTYFTTY